MRQWETTGDESALVIYPYTVVNFRLLFNLLLIRSSTARGSGTSVLLRWSLQKSAPVPRASHSSRVIWPFWRSWHHQYVKIKLEHFLQCHVTLSKPSSYPRSVSFTSCLYSVLPFQTIWSIVACHYFLFFLPWGHTLPEFLLDLYCVTPGQKSAVGTLELYHVSPILLNQCWKISRFFQQKGKKSPDYQHWKWGEGKTYFVS